MRTRFRLARAGLFCAAMGPMLGLTCIDTGPRQYGKTTTWQRRTIDGAVSAVRPSAVLVQDFDSDSKLDVLVAYQGENLILPGVFIFFQDAVDSFTPVSISSGADLTGVAAVATGDLDADGRSDVVAACNGRLVYLHSPTTPRLASGWTSSTIDQSALTGTGQWTDVAVADIDNQNGLDLVACNKTSNWLSWFVNPNNAASGTGWTRVQIDSTTRSAAEAVAVGQISGGASKIDIFSTASSESTARAAWYRNPTTPATDAWTKFTIGNLTAISRFAIGDLNVDGREDMVVVNGPGRIVGWYLRPASVASAWTGYKLTDYTNTNAGPPRPIDVKIADVDGDSQPDVIVATEQMGTLRWFVPVGAQTNYWGENNIADMQTNEDVVRIATGDIDNDGRPDVVATLRGATSASDSVAWFENPEP